MQGQGAPCRRSRYAFHEPESQISGYHEYFRSRSRSRGAFNRRSNYGEAHPIQPAVLASIVEEPSSSIMPVVNPLMVAAKELKFPCQLAHGSPVAIIDKWNDMEELYQSIADFFAISKDDIIFLTVNDFKASFDTLIPLIRNIFSQT